MLKFESSDLEHFEYIRNFNYPSLVQQEVLGKWNLRECAEILSNASQYFIAATDEELSALPFQRIRMIASAAAEMVNVINECEKLSRNSSISENDRNNVLSAAHTAYQNTFDAIAPALSVFKKSQEHLATIKKTLAFSERTREQIEKDAITTKSAAESLKSAATAAGFDANANLFSKARNDYQKSSKKWLICTFISIAIFISATAFLTYCPPPINTNLKWAEIIFLSNKLFLLGGFGFSIFVSYKNYISAKHNETVNLQRSNALSTYQAVISELSQEEKVPIIIAAANCIYNHQGSGYSPIEPSISILGPAVDTIKSVTK